MSMVQRLGREPLIHERVTQHNVTFGTYNEIGPDSILENVTFGDYAYSGPWTIIQNADVGAFSNLAASIRIGPTAHPMDRPTQHHFTYRRAMYGFHEQDDEAFFAWRSSQRVEIEPDTWLGHGAIVMPGVRIGLGAVVGAGAVVTRDVPDFAVVVGSPARMIRQRFSDRVAEALKAIAWWTWSHEALRAALDDFSGPVEAFIEKYGVSSPLAQREDDRGVT